MSEYRIGIIGDYDSICGFSALGIDTFSVESSIDCQKLLSSLIKSGYGIIFLTENYCKDVIDIIDQYRTVKMPAIIPVPSLKGGNGFGISYVKKAVEQAVGSDIIFND